jgi:hypothetical protein
MFLSMAKGDQSDLVFSGVFSLVWVGEAVVTLQIKLLGGNMYDFQSSLPPVSGCLSANVLAQFVLSVYLYHRLHALPSCYRCASQRIRPAHDRPDTGLPGLDCLVSGRRSEYSRGLWCRAEPGRYRGISAVCLLYCDRLSLLYQLSKQRECPALCKKTTRALKLQIIEKHARIPPGQGD